MKFNNSAILPLACAVALTLGGAMALNRRSNGQVAAILPPPATTSAATSEPAPAAGPVIDQDADRIFGNCCKYLAQAKGFSCKVEVWEDVVLPTGQKLQTTRNLEVEELRPNRLHIETRSPRTNRGMWYQGKTLTLLDRNVNFYGVMDVPDSVDQMIDAVKDRFGIDIPLADVLVADPYKDVMDVAMTADDMGKVTVLGTSCHHLAFTTDAVDFQIWIAEGSRPLPRKIVITYRNKEGSPQVTGLFTDWDLVSPIADSAFEFTPPAEASRIEVSLRKADEAFEAPADISPATLPAVK